MVGALLLLAACSLLGYSWTSGKRGGLLLAPAVGLASTVLLSYFLSANFDLVGATAVAVALPLLVALSIAREWRLRKTFAQRYSLVRTDLRDAGLALLPVLLLIVPALHQGVSDFFGVGNFDFFHNSQDGWYLASHSVGQYGADAFYGVLPLVWSANAQGRFAISLLSAFANKYAHINTLHFNAVLLTTCVAAAGMSAHAFAVRMLNLTGRWAVFAVLIFICSAGFAQGYSYFLLGQISALPLFLALATSLKPLVDTPQGSPTSEEKVTWAHITIIAFWLNALYVFYAILAFFGGALLMAAAMLNMCGRKDMWKSAAVRVMQVIVVTLLLFLLLRAFSLPAAAHAIIEWIHLSLKTAGTTVDGPKVFTEYLTEGFFALLLGMVRYPSSQSVFGSLLIWEGSSSVPLLVLSIVGVLSFLVVFVFFATGRTIPRSGKVTLGALCLISLSCALAFFISGSGYAIFKIGSWFIPICLIGTAAALSLQRQLPGVNRAILVSACFILLGANLVAAFNYSFAFLPLRKVFGYRENAKMVEMSDVHTLKNWLATQPVRQVELDFVDVIKAAWFANELRDMPFQVVAYTHNFQPLADKVVVPPACRVGKSQDFDQSILVSEHFPGDGQDIIVSMQPTPRVAFSAGNYHAFDMRQVALYATLGRGTYPSYRLSDNEARNNKLPRTLRWVEKGFELYIFSRRPGYVDIAMEAAPGFMNGPESRTLTLNGNAIRKQEVFSKAQQHVRYDRIPVNAGMNCLYFESTDDVRNITRYGALFRESVMAESRFLNFAIGQLAINYHD
ncbi:hypothetical protein C798_02540 [Herbaspirillum rubrisubalbicans Os34]|uniref:Uncharacterized protein n=1 Tax=Herbaspirillum rubrisubalbicans Os34 TaxID=1235827 RepID=A0A6M3ZKF3_9BURK|nr:hypothetical protein [Herbaspirillum rubrisubalbicans]QJP99148.1 hypothetical protein C798_02540 [Herbaspirillum rubrisubalbicans Os34]